MTFKIFRSSFIVAVCVLILSTLLSLAILNDYNEEQIYIDLSSEAESIVHGIELSGEKYFNDFHPRNRVTHIAADGTVLYDSDVDISSMENHLDRQEVSDALELGSGKNTHFSRTLTRKTLNFALLSSDGTVIRVSCEERSLVAIFGSMLSAIFWVLILALVLSAVLASRMARKIVRPLNELDLDHPALSTEYSELAPLVNRIREQNITISRQIEELSLRQKEFSAITDNMSEGFLLIDHRATVLSSNRSALLLLGSPDGSVVRNLYQLDCPDELKRCADSALAGRRAEISMPSGEHTLCFIASPVVSSGQVTGAVITIMDITEREQRETLRREFSANVSHELKTPLTSISGFAELMKEGIVPPEKVPEFAGDIYAESRRLIALVDDIIKLSGLDEDSPAFEPEPVDLHSLAAEIIESLQPVAAKRGITLSLRGESVEIKGVRQILSEMIYNLCDNAIKYNKEGGSVDVHVRRNNPNTIVTVADTGIGIPYAHQSRVFERFYRVDKSHSKEIGGTGLGLSIVKHGAQYHNARTELKSEPGKGTSISIIF
ncbi:MAG: histidine kinase [Oscillospiraceae bacterium]|nr:histidine kinase [Oscillospiraceae bacterium]